MRRSARAGTKRRTHWDGYKVHLTETCEPDAPHLITNVATSPAPGSDYDMTPAIHTDLAARGLLPDTGAAGPPPDRIHRHRLHRLERPARHLPGRKHQHRLDHRNPTRPSTVHRIEFSRATCTPARCATAAPARPNPDAGSPSNPRPNTKPSNTPAAPKPPPRGRTTTKHATASKPPSPKAPPATRLRRARYRGHAKTHLQHVLTATAMNLTRLDAWLTEHTHAEHPHIPLRRAPPHPMKPPLEFANSVPREGGGWRRRRAATPDVPPLGCC